ncbi:MAG: decaprenyl-phosphate phosphoribosyltransferase [Anaerolineales bacterium]|nr:decaprenyl-phosphate phosphoribosyltransferase [Anaerolineales bacterium]MCB0012100.1 decaprenyl-phosphate phosphoribosyltransferase [Anaerolineales bacterium]MCB0017137.1 decaprenyl-phosphate phosphoribosyltransferase [Anaerolineales bacterium]MCB8961994.1 decaprenyl-phosphate phosphoribosyltransferase [Ardenticatenales bacterium]
MLLALLKTMRPRQWPKNVFVFVALVFDGKLVLQALGTIERVFTAFVLFCLISSAVYIMNDLADIEEDRLHPKKKFRPLPAGDLPIPVARIAMIVFGFGSLGLSFYLDQVWGTNLFIILLTYTLLQIAYTLYLKRIVLLDVSAVAAGFVLRVAAGVAMFDETRFSPWLYLCIALLSLFLVLGKRRHELIILGEDAARHRSILAEYTIGFLDQLIMIVTTSAIVSYSLYTFLAEGLPEDNLMMLTIPFAAYALFRWLYLMYVQGKGGAPEDLALEDRPLQITSLLFVLMVIFVLYIAK